MDNEEAAIAEEIRAGSFDADDAPEGAVVEPVAEPAAGRAEGGRAPWVGALKIGLVFALLGGGVAFLLWGTGASDAFVYSKLVDEVMTDPGRFRGRELRVQGQLQTGSIVFQAEPSCEHRFVLASHGYSMPVRFPRCVVPDTLRDDMAMDVVVQGQLQDDDTFLANEVIPRCPSKYEMRQRQQNGEEMPHAPVSPGSTS